MKVSPINNTQPQFKATIVRSHDYNALMEFVSNFANSNSSNMQRSKELLEAVQESLIAFPTDAKLKFTKMLRDPREYFIARGVVESQYAKFTDVEPARETSYVPIPNIMKRILNPDNKDYFNKLMGNKDDSIRSSWWDKNIRPIWNDILLNFYEDTVYRRDTHPDYNLIFRNNTPLEG